MSHAHDTNDIADKDSLVQRVARELIYQTNNRKKKDNTLWKQMVDHFFFRVLLMKTFQAALVKHNGRFRWGVHLQ